MNSIRLAIAAALIGAAPLRAQDAAPPRLLSTPADQGTCTVSRFVGAAPQRDSGVTRVYVVSERGKPVRQLTATEDSRGRLTRLVDVSIAGLENVDVRLATGRPRASWHTTGDVGMADSAAAVAAERVGAFVKRRCPGP